ncbi:hypothetical protein [Mycolicibacterium hodleri]|uniref:SDR family NAD(P)-dependent oxidoreductase n=1 Tax=Mycolicibacterium hodleri TaxID=49897 RepID=A0A502E458_9MYCO|nr:hypothetical protein [Mycolicibacterium hodleri]TPG32495.1 hypothetical protein EAH80_19705 [Mycolicibacterium hodleri]
MELRGQAILVSGGGSGLGLATAAASAELAAHVTVAELEASDRSAITAALAGRGRFVVADVTDADQELR